MATRNLNEGALGYGGPHILRIDLSTLLMQFLPPSMHVHSTIVVEEHANQMLRQRNHLE